MPKKSTYSRKQMLKEQKKFYKEHPNAKPLLLSFLILVVLMGVLYYLQYGFELMPAM